MKCPSCGFVDSEDIRRTREDEETSIVKTLVDEKVIASSSCDDVFDMLEPLVQHLRGEPCLNESCPMFNPGQAFQIRFARIWGWSIPSRSALDELVSFIGRDSAVEIGAGRGLWALLLRNRGIEVHASSLADIPYGYYTGKDMKLTWSPVEIRSYEDAVVEHADCNCLFVSWGYRILEGALELFAGRKLAVIGQPPFRGIPGCTDWVTDDIATKYNLRLEREVVLPTFCQIGDRLMLYARGLPPGTPFTG